MSELFLLLTAGLLGGVVNIVAVAGGYIAARVLQVFNQGWVRRLTVGVAAFVTIFFFRAAYAVV
jgi:hypothetical protein